MKPLHRHRRAGVAAGLSVAVTAGLCLLGPAVASAAPAAGPAFTALPHSIPVTADHRTGAYHSSRMTVEVALAPSDGAGLTRTLQAMYTKGSATYHHWLRRGQFDAAYAPAAAERAQVASYLKGAGLRVTAAPSPFLVRATGSSTQVATAFRTTLTSYRDQAGHAYFQNSAAIQVPAVMAGYVQGVIGLTNSVREHDQVQRATGTRPSGTSPASASCETSYPTTAQLFNQVNNGTGFPYGYGGGPGCSGLTPAQTNSLYRAPAASTRTKGGGVTIGVFELSAYQASDISTWAQNFYGAAYTPPLTNVTVDGGPLNPACPAGDTCPPQYNGYSGDIEVDADIEMQLAVAPDVASLVVYNAPNDYTGQTELDEYTAIADADQAESVSSSWGICENDVTGSYVQSENTIFEQMALQGQSMFGAEGDTGAFGCIRSDGTDIPNVWDPAVQPWVTSVGGTSFENDNPGTNPSPGAPPAGTETVWNVDDLCSNAASAPANDNQGGYFWCAQTGAGAGGSSQWWGRPYYQAGPGVNNPNTTYGNGSTNCALATTGTPCREVPDVSADADPYTGYAEYCTGNASTPYSECGTFSGSESVPGWFAIGGTSLSSPLWSAIIADRDGYQGSRSGNMNPVLYQLFQQKPKTYFNDITGAGQTTNNNGLFPTTPGYDEATGIGTPKMGELIRRSL